MNRKALVDALTRLSPSFAKDPLLEELRYFRFRNTEVRASDGTSISSVQLPEPTGLNCLVPAGDFYRLLSAITQDEVQLKLDGETLKVVAHGLKGKFVVRLESDYLDKLDFEVDEWKDCPAGFLRGLSLAKFAAAKDASSGVLRGVMINGTDIISSDRLRINRFRTKESITDTPIIIPIDLVNMIERFNDIKQWSAKNGAIYFLSETKAVIAGRLLTGDFPDVSGFYAQAEKLDRSVTLPAALSSILDHHVALFKDVSDLSEWSVKITVKGGSMYVSTDLDNKSLEEDLCVAGVEGDMAFQIHPMFLKDILKFTPVMKWNPESNFVCFGITEEVGQLEHLMVIQRS
jgi:hypothetical protein